MKTKGKAWHLIATVLLIVVFVYTAFFGVYAKYGDTTTTYIKGAKDIRFGVDIKGGVNVTFVPSDGYDATEEQLEAAQLVIENRLVALNVTDYELYVDNNSDSLILEFPWQSGETDFDPEAAIDEIGTTAYLTFREGSSADGELILDGSMIESAAAQYGPVSNGGASEYFVSLKFTDDGAKAFGDATTKLAASGGTISIWLDDENVSTATVNTAITDGSAIITSSASNPFTQEQVVKMARQINSGALPFALTVDSYSTVSPSLGENSLSAMVLAGLIAFALIVVFMTMLYRLPGFLACIALAGQVAATLAFVSGYFPVFESFTMTLPGIAGIILAIGMGVDANVITAERIKEELKNGKSLDGALKSGFARGLTPIVDGNVTIVIVAIVLMGAFGTSDGMFAKALHFVFFAFGPSTACTHQVALDELLGQGSLTAGSQMDNVGVVAALHGGADDVLQLLVGGQVHLDAGLGGKGLGDLLPHLSAVAGLDGGYLDGNVCSRRCGRSGGGGCHAGCGGAGRAAAGSQTQCSGANAGRLQEITTRNTIHTVLPPSFCSVQTQPGKQALHEGLCVFLPPI